MTTFFQVGEIVWGKIKGYPYWPSKIIDISSNLIYTIKFYNDNSYAKLSSKFLFTLYLLGFYYRFINKIILRIKI